MNISCSRFIRVSSSSTASLYCDDAAGDIGLDALMLNFDTLGLLHMLEEFLLSLIKLSNEVVDIGGVTVV